MHGRIVQKPQMSSLLFEYDIDILWCDIGGPTTFPQLGASWYNHAASQNRQVVMNNHPDNDHPRFDVQVLFDSIGVVLDDHQYRDAISLVDMFHFYRRQHQVLAGYSRNRRACADDYYSVP